jgi:hypothetical protein
MNKTSIWLFLGIISTLSIASIAWNDHRNHYLFKECIATMGKMYPSWDSNIENISKASAYGYSVCKGGFPTFGR